MTKDSDDAPRLSPREREELAMQAVLQLPYGRAREVADRNFQPLRLALRLDIEVELALDSDEAAYERACSRVFSVGTGYAKSERDRWRAFRVLSFELDRRGPNADVAAGILRELSASPLNYGDAVTCVEIMVRNRIPRLDDALRDILGGRQWRAAFKELGRLPRARADALMRSRLEGPDPRVLGEALGIAIDRWIAIAEEPLRRLMLHPDALVRRLAARVAARQGLEPSCPDALALALCDHEPSIRRARQQAMASGYRHGVRMPAAITAEPFTLPHQVAFLVLRAPLAGRRALAQHLRRCPVSEARALADQLDAAERDHQRQLLLRALLATQNMSKRASSRISR